MSKTQSTPKSRKASTSRPRARAQEKPNQLSALLARIGAKVTATDRKTARTLDALYRSPQTPQLIKHAIFQIFWDVAHFYGLQLPKNFDSKWLPFWEAICACNRRHEYIPTSIRYTWQPTEEDNARLVAEEKEENDARAIFDLIHNEQLKGSEGERIRDGVTAILDSAHPLNCLDVFLVAWPIALEKLAEQKASDQ